MAFLWICRIGTQRKRVTNRSLLAMDFDPCSDELLQIVIEQLRQPPRYLRGLAFAVPQQPSALGHPSTGSHEQVEQRALDGGKTTVQDLLVRVRRVGQDVDDVPQFELVPLDDSRVEFVEVLGEAPTIRKAAGVTHCLR